MLVIAQPFRDPRGPLRQAYTLGGRPHRPMRMRIPRGPCTVARTKGKEGVVDARATRPVEGLGTGQSWPGSRGDEWVERARLLLDLELTSAPVIMVTGAAGAGKSTLAGQWLRDSNRVTGALRLTPHLDDPAALATALLDALDPHRPAVAGARGPVTSTEPGFSAVLLPTVQRMVASAPAPFAIVIDDLQFIRDPACHRLLACACDAVPSGSQLMLLSRDTTPSWLAMARAQGRLAEYGPTVFGLRRRRGRPAVRRPRPRDTAGPASAHPPAHGRLGRRALPQRPRDP